MRPQRHGGWKCPVPGCGYTDVIWPFIERHIEREHPEWKAEKP